MGAKRPLLIALAISLIGHVVFVLLFPQSESEHRVARFDVELVPQQPATAVEPEPEVQHPAHPPELLAPPEEESVVQEAPLSPTPDEPESAAPTVRLNLGRPQDWDQIVREIPAPTAKLAFNPSLGEAVQKRNAERQRELLVASRQMAVYGVADEDFSPAEVFGQQQQTKLKMEGGCVTLVEDRAVEKGQRWWATQCTDTRQNAFTLPVIDYDALGRAIVD